MNFEYSEEQTMLKDSVARFVREQYDFDTRRAIVASEAGMSQEFWAMFAELGWLSVPFAEEYGGYGGTSEDVAAMMEELGKGNVVEPFVATVLLFGGLLARSDNKDLKSAVIPKIIDGTCLGAFGFLERQSRFELTDVKTSATASDVGWVLNGDKAVVVNAANADQLIVTARTSGGQFDRQGISLFLLDSNAEGVEISSFVMMDGQKVANISLRDVVVPASQQVGVLDAGMDLVDLVIPQVLLALCSEALGIMVKLNEATLNYTKTRKQFGVPISSFQILQHRMVDTFMAAEQARSMVYRGLCAFGDGGSIDSTERYRSLHAMKVVVAKSSKLIGEEAIQMHGGMGMTDELDIGHFVKRLMTLNVMFGDGDFHQKKFNQLSYQSA